MDTDLQLHGASLVPASTDSTDAQGAIALTSSVRYCDLHDDPDKRGQMVCVKDKSYSQVKHLQITVNVHIFKTQFFLIRNMTVTH